MKLIKAGIIAGIIGIVLMVCRFFILWFFNRMFSLTDIANIALIVMVLMFVIPGVIAGILASRYVMSAKESLLPGVIAGTLVAVVQVLELASINLPVIGGQHGAEIFKMALPGILVQEPFAIALAGLCSALAVFFTRELYWSIPVSAKNGDADTLKKLYDELWSDARTMVLDLNRSIRVYLFAGILMILFGLVILYYGFGGWQHIRAIETSNPLYVGPSLVPVMDYLVVACEIAGGLIQLLTGLYLLYWYYELKKRYSRLMQMEKTIGA